MSGKENRLPLAIYHFLFFLGLMTTVIFPVASATRSNLLPFVDDSPHTLFERGMKFLKEEKLDSALVYFSFLIGKYQDADDKETRLFVGKSFSEIGQIYYVHRNDYMSAYRCLEKAENIFRESDDKSSYASVLLNFGNLFNMYECIFPNDKRNAYVKSREFYNKAMQTAADIEDWNLVLSAYINSIMLDLPFKINQNINNRIGILLRDSIPKTAPDYKLSLFLCEGTNAIAARNFDTARRIMLEIRDSLGLEAPREKYMARICQTAVSIGEGNYEEAINYLNGIFSEKSRINDIDVHMEVYGLLSKCYKLADNRTMSDFYRIKYYEAKDTLTKELVGLEPTRLGIELSNVKNYAMKVDSERRLVKTILLFSIILVVVLLVIAIIIYRKNSQLKLKNQVIFNQTQSLLQNTDKSDTPSTETEVQPEKYRDSSMTDETRHELIEKINKVLENVDEICNSNFSLQRLTQLVESNTSYISRAINEHYGMTFGTLLNKYRIQEACRRMTDIDKYGNLTIEAISESVGFNTRSTFTKAFRLNIGMLPSEYAKLIKKGNSTS
ncbi:MAG: AraC family transcriptional regulator [Muribaculaceae bacterium]|nr:AraC family transcriptional regulator [Muribaculaceae bacterium]